MEKSVLIKGDNYDISGIFSYTETVDKMPAVILCHGTGAQKNEVGDLFVILAEKLLQRGIASVRIDYAGCGDSKADQRELTFLGEVEDTKKAYQYICDLGCVDQKNIGILGFSQGARVVAELLKEMQELRKNEFPSIQLKYVCPVHLEMSVSHKCQILYQIQQMFRTHIFYLLSQSSPENIHIGTHFDNHILSALLLVGSRS